MNRIIKFRAWDTEEKKMWFNVQDAYDTLGDHCIHGEDCERNNDECFFSLPSFGDVLREKSFVVMQFTGLLDKNGKEIYEGDVLNVVEENDNDHGFDLAIGEKVCIKWMDGGFRLIRPQHYDNDKNGFCEICASPAYLYSENHEIDIGFYSEIIGNIYESKHPLDNTETKA